MSGALKDTQIGVLKTSTFKTVNAHFTGRRHNYIKKATKQTNYYDLQQLVMLTLMLILNHSELKYSSNLANIRGIDAYNTAMWRHKSTI